MTNNGKRKRLGARPGSSLIETILAMALAFFLMVGTAEMLVLALRVQGRARSIMDMTNLVSARLEALRAEAAAVRAQGTNAIVADGRAAAAGRDTRRYTLSWTAAAEAGSPYIIDVRIVPDEAPERAFAMPLFISRELGF
ncbi:MAG: hypothetical protein PHI34_12900 [Acidobacteriota bacterium]|nr:hypothetical protein [Acidobacteriota bacterium]